MREETLEITNQMSSLDSNQAAFSQGKKKEIGKPSKKTRERERRGR